ncbi:hypothetical protein MLD38_040470 [Melastoma candidum]|nr:hypothetical protein MLD38_040470 [Melastoma candidum]
MASHTEATAAALPAEDDDLDEDDDFNSPSTSSPVLPTATPILDPLLSSVTVAVPAPSSASAALPSDRKPLFQRLWTDEDEIELLRGFLHYTAQRGGVPNPDVSLFYDQIKSKLQLDFNKNQLVEKLRRLKKKFRNAVIRINSGKDVSFKSPHDQAAFEISRKIWSNSIGIVGNLNNHGSADLNVEDDDEIVRGHGFVSSASPSFGLNPNPISEIKSEDLHRTSNSKMRKRFRLMDKSSVTMRVEERNDLNLGGDGNSVMLNNSVNNVYGFMNVPGSSGGSAGNNGNGNSTVGLIEETVRSCLAPVFNQLLGGGLPYGVGLNMGRIGGIAAALNPLSFGLGGMGFGEVGSGRDERWRKQQIMELEVFSRRLELVQEQIKATLEELHSRGR